MRLNVHLLDGCRYGRDYGIYYITISMCKLVVVGLKLSSRRDLVSDKRDAL